MTGNFDLLGQLEANFNTKKISIVEFSESPAFCNRLLYPRQKLLLKLFFLEELTPQEERVLEYWQKGGRHGSEIELSPGINERIQILRDQGRKHFREIVLVGGRRCSKGFITALALAKKMFEAVQLQDPGRYYGIDLDKEIYFACVAASLDQAKSTQYADFSSMINSCQALQRNIHKVQHLEFSVMTEGDIRKMASWKRQKRKVERDISKLRGAALPANARTIRGKAIMGMVFDEFAHFQQGESDQCDSEVYAAAKPSLDQFGRDAIIFCNSSPFSKVGTLYERWEEGMATENGTPLYPEVLTLRFPSWALFEGWWEDPLYTERGGLPKCITVSPDWEIDRLKSDGSYFYSPDDRANVLQQRQEELSDPVKFKVERRGRFAEVIDAYLIPEMVDRMFEGRPLGMNDEGHWEYARYAPNWDNTSYLLKYYAHCDPSSTTAGFGFALGHVEGFTLRDKLEQHTVFDMIRRWNPKDFEGHTIDWEPILEWMLHICDLFRPVQLSFDHFNSEFPITWLQREFRKRRIETRVFKKVPTAQSNWDRAEIFRTALNRGYIHGPATSFHEDLAYASEELKYLQEIKTTRIPRVEKQDIGPVQTKDMADAMMEVVEATIGDLMATQVREELSQGGIHVGAPGGYPLGGPDRGGYGRPMGRTNPFSDIYYHNMAEHRAKQAARVNPARHGQAARRGRRF